MLPQMKTDITRMLQETRRQQQRQSMHSEETDGRLSEIKRPSRNSSGGLEQKDEERR